MYAKLVVGASNGNIYQGIRDICRLITSAAPSISDLSGQGFSTTASAIIDPTPAGWTYVGSTKATDQPSIGSGAADATFNVTTPQYWACSAPMADYPSRLKYAVFGQNSNQSAYSYSGTLFGAASVTALGVVTSPSYYYYSTASTPAIATNACPIMTANTTLHLVATPRGVVVVREGSGFNGVLEMSSTTANDFYNQPAFCAFSMPGMSTNLLNATGAGTGTGSAVNALNLTNVNTGAALGAYSVNQGNLVNSFTALQNGTVRAMSQDSAGLPKYSITPVYIHNTFIGYPVQFISGIFPIYWCKSDLGSTGDTVTINGNLYTFFNCGSGSNTGLLMATS